MLGLEHSARIEKVSVLVEAIQEIKRITGKNRELRVNNEAMKFSLNGLVGKLWQHHNQNVGHSNRCRKELHLLVGN